MQKVSTRSIALQRYRYAQNPDFYEALQRQYWSRRSISTEEGASLLVRQLKSQYAKANNTYEEEAEFRQQE